MTVRAARDRLVALAVAGAAVVLAGLGLPLAHGALTPTVTNSNDTVASTPYYTCTAAGVGSTTSNRAYFTWAFSDGPGATVKDVSTNNRNGTYDGTAGITYGVASGVCARDNTTVVTFDGSQGYADYDTQIPAAGQGSFTLEVWFRSADTQGGFLAGFGSAATGASGSVNRLMFVGADGKLVFGTTSSSGTTTVMSPGRVDDGGWHQAIATYVNNSFMTLYLDGVSVGTPIKNTSPTTSAGYLRMAYDSLTGWPDRPTSNDFFGGSMAYASVYGYVLAADQIKSHYVAGKP